MDRQISDNSTSYSKNILNRLIGVTFVCLLPLGLIACDGAEAPFEDPALEPELSDKDLLIQGARLYDNWIKQAAAQDRVVVLPTTTTLWDSRAANTNLDLTTLEDQWLCVTCHAWDYQGKEGYNAVGSPLYTNFPKLTFVAENIGDGHIEEHAINIITHGYYSTTLGKTVHVFGEDADPTDPSEGNNGENMLTEVQILALAIFIQDGIYDTEKSISPDEFLIRGDVDNGEALFAWSQNDPDIRTAECGNCHKVTGTGNPNETPTRAEIGLLANENPYKAIHKIRFGAPPTENRDVMVGMVVGEFEMHDVNDVLKYTQTLAPPPAAAAP